MTSAPHPSARQTTRERIVAAAARLLREGDSEAVTTRAVAAGAGVQVPAIYRVFGDKRGLLDAVAEHEATEWAMAKDADSAHDEDRDPVAVLRDGWLAVTDFGLHNPAVFHLMNDREGYRDRAAAQLGEEVLKRRIRRVAAAGRLAVSEERALNLIRASAVGAVLVLAGQAEADRDLGLLDQTLEGLLATIIAGEARRAPGPIPARASALRAAIRERPVALSAGEAMLLDELLVRLGRPGG